MDPQKSLVSPKVAIYCRYSSDAQKHSLSIEAQTRACQEFSKKQGWTIYKLYIDEARSGTSDKREAFQRMITDAVAATPPFDIVLVHKSDRFARNREDAVKYKALLKRQKIRFYSATEPIGSGDVTEVLLESMLDGIAEFYSLQLSQRTLAGMAEAARNGWSIGMPPYGYKLVAVDTLKGKKKKLVVDTTEARVVRRIFALYASGDGVHTIREKLGKKEYRFNKNFLFRMLRNERYIGHTSYGKRPAPGSKTSIEPIRIENTHEAIIDKKIWDKVQMLFEQKNAPNVTRFVQSDYLLSGVLKCSCGGAMVGHSGNGNGGRFRYYGCGNMLRSGKKVCSRPSINANQIEDIVFKKIEDYLTDEENILQLIETNNAALDKMKRNKSKDVAKLRSDLSHKDMSAKNIMRAVEAGEGLNIWHVAGRLEELQREKTAIESRIHELESFQSLEPISQNKADILFSYLNNLFKSGLIRNKTLLQGLLADIQLSIDGKSAKVLYRPDFHDKPDTIPLQKKSPRGRNEHGSHGEHLATQEGLYANLLGEQVIYLDFKAFSELKRLNSGPRLLTG
jgi:site-specific DNA recombinase